MQRLLGIGNLPRSLSLPTHPSRTTQSQKASRSFAMSPPNTTHSTPLDHSGTSKVHSSASTTKSKPGTSFSLKDSLKSLRGKSFSSSSTTHRVKLNGLQKPENQLRGIGHSVLSHLTDKLKLTRPPQTHHKTSLRRVEIVYSRLHSETFLRGGYNIQRVLAFAIRSVQQPDCILCRTLLPRDPCDGLP